MRISLTLILVALFVLSMFSGLAVPVLSLVNPDGPGDPSGNVKFTRPDEGAIPPPASAPLLPEKGAPGGYRGPGEDAVPTGWNTWAQDEHNQCGDLRLVFGNQDLNRELQSEDGIVYAEGSFFIQFQAIGEAAQDITRFSFSFGKSHEEINQNELLNCNTALPDNPLGKGTAGVYIPFYRSDFDEEDGFFIPVETRNVPDGTYAAAVHAYTGEFPNYQEVARAWALADVFNCEGTGEDYCNGEEYDDDPAVIANDNTQPWPMVLPGDGQQTHDVDGLTIEILEPVTQITASINGEEIELENWTPPPRDRDVLPMNDDGGELEGCPGDLMVHPVCNHMEYSHGWKYEGGVEIGDVIQMEAVDRNGNSVFRSIFWDGEGGVIAEDFPIIDFNLLSRPSVTIQAGEERRYDIRVENTGGSQAHVDFWLALNGSSPQEQIDEEHLKIEWEDMSWDHDHPTHIHLDPGQVVETYVDFTTTAQTPNGTYQVEASLTYPALDETQTRAVDLEIEVDGVVEMQENETEEEDSDLEESPPPGLIVTTSVLGVVALLVARRRMQT